MHFHVGEQTSGWMQFCMSLYSSIIIDIAYDSNFQTELIDF